MNVVRPRPYYVSYADATPDERGPGWFWCENDDADGDRIRGPYYTRRDAEDAIDQFMWDHGKPA